MRFAKYNGIGNDFVLLADLENRITLTPEIVRRVCDRRFGVGGDGIIRVAPGDDGAELFMDYYNADGSVGEMCGNGIRCLAVFARREGLTASSDMVVGTRAGPKAVSVRTDDHIRVDMGAPEFEPAAIPVIAEGDDALGLRLSLDGPFGHGDPVEVTPTGGDVVEAACLSMGNPHAVLFVDDPATAPVTSMGPLLERHKAFPNKTNVEFVHVESATRLRMRVWERGVGETLACGTGACAAAVAARCLQRTNARVTVELPGGCLDVEWNGSVQEPTSVYMTGPAVQNFDGDIDLEEYA